MKPGIIITLPRHDQETEYLSCFSVFIEAAAEKKGLSYKKLKDSEATKRDFEKALDKLDFKMVVFNGHGSETAIGGYNNESIIELSNSILLQQRITYARVCGAAAVLGKKCIEKGGCFIGYQFPFMFYSDERWSATPLKDKIASLFLEASNAVPISLIKGNTTFEANENSKQSLLKNINKVLQNKDQDSALIAEALWNNYLAQVLLGDEKAVL